MNLRVDLILESEQRSGSRINPKAVLRGITILIPGIILLALAAQVVQVVGLQRELKHLRAEMERKGPQREKAQSLVEEYRAHRDIQKEFNGWKRTRIDWHTQLTGLMQAVPTNIQLGTLTLSQTLQLYDDKVPSRLYTMTMQGKAVNEDAQASIKELKQQFTFAPAFTSLTQEVTVPHYAAGEENNEDRVFEMRCVYRAQKFEDLKTRRKRRTQVTKNDNA